PILLQQSCSSPRTTPPAFPPFPPSRAMYKPKPMTRRAKDPLMAINSDLKPLTPEEVPANDSLADTPSSRKTNRPENSGDIISVSPDETNPAVLDDEDGGAETLPDTEEYAQILEELRHAKTEKAVSARRNRKP